MTSSSGNIFRVIGLCTGNTPVTAEFPSQRPVTRSFALFLDLHLNKRLSKQSRRRWFEKPSRSLWRHCNEYLSYLQSTWLTGHNSNLINFRFRVICTWLPIGNDIKSCLFQPWDNAHMNIGRSLACAVCCSNSWHHRSYKSLYNLALAISSYNVNAMKMLYCVSVEFSFCTMEEK